MASNTDDEININASTTPRKAKESLQQRDVLGITTKEKPDKISDSDMLGTSTEPTWAKIKRFIANIIGFVMNIIYHSHQSSSYLPKTQESQIPGSKHGKTELNERPGTEYDKTRLNQSLESKHDKTGLIRMSGTEHDKSELYQIPESEHDTTGVNQKPAIEHDNNSLIIRKTLMTDESEKAFTSKFDRTKTDQRDVLSFRPKEKPERKYNSDMQRTSATTNIDTIQGYLKNKTYQSKQSPAALTNSSRPQALNYQGLVKLRGTKSDVEMLKQLCKPDSGFKQLLNTKRGNMDANVIECLLEVLVDISSCDNFGSRENIIQVITDVRNSIFLQTHLSQYYMNIMVDRDPLQYLEPINNSMKLFKKLIEIQPSSAREIIIAQTTLERVVITSHETTNFQFPAQTIQEVTELQAECEKLMSNDENQCKKRQKRFSHKGYYDMVEDDVSPPDNFRSVSILPTNDDIKSTERPALQPNIEVGRYKDLYHYLDVHFRLLREDFLHPLREGISTYRDILSTGDMNRKLYNIKIYRKVQILHSVCAFDGISHLISFDVSKHIKWASAKRLMHGSLLCLSKDNFENVIFATVSKSSPDVLENGKLEIQFTHELADGDLLNSIYVMAESTAFFEAYRHVLKGLQNVSDDLPFQKYLIHCIREIDPPKYVLENKNINFNIPFPLARHLKLMDDKSWPTFQELELDMPQYLALKAALRNEMAIIEGPPGTGKTYIGLKIMQCFLKNQGLWKSPEVDEPSPILVVCLTNHALDQFLEGILVHMSSGQKLIRVGGRSKSNVLESMILGKYRERMRNTGSTPQRYYCESRDASNEKHELKMKIAQSELEQSEDKFMDEHVLRRHMSKEHFVALQSQCSEDICGDRDKYSNLLSWLGFGDLHKSSIYFGCEKICTDNFDDENDDINEPIQTDDQWQYQKNERERRKRAFKTCIRNEGAMTTREVNILGSICDLEITDRWRLYRYWVRQYQEALKNIIVMHKLNYQHACTEHQLALENEDRYVMGTAAIIGMTTTGAAKYRRVLEQLRPKIVIVEEAAEVLEAQIITCLSSACEHLILIGDHKQLQPNLTVYELAERFKLNVSLFERMINNGIPCVTLETQHRMRPDISMFMKHIYPKLKDSESVKGMENVKGVSKNVFLINHSYVEDHDDESTSKSNLHEVNYIKKLCWYLLQQGYMPEQITILTGYAGQVLLLNNKLPKQQFEGVRISAIDNFQGEENDIILISLVRSNEKRSVGFLKADNRVCVAMSRARQGLYVIGNFELLRKSCKLWEKIVKTAEDNKVFGSALPLYCRNHPEDGGLEVKDHTDFAKAPEGGCMKPCQARLNCGHQCTLKCHPYDPEHRELRCTKPCPKVTCDKHQTQCQRMCYQECDVCEEPVEKQIPGCEHVQMVPCFIVPCRYIMCRKKCDAILDCGHECSGTCGQCLQGKVHTTCRTPACIDNIICGRECEGFCKKINYVIQASNDLSLNDHISAEMGTCQEKCLWKCQHLACSNKCSDPCNRGRCNFRCEKKLRCSHQCAGICGERCPPLCLVCNREDLQKIHHQYDHHNPRFIQLIACKHIFEVTALDKYMDDAGNGYIRNIKMKACPKCHTPIQGDFRYGNVTKPIVRDITAGLQENHNQIVAHTADLKRELLRIQNQLEEGIYMNEVDENNAVLFFDDVLHLKHGIVNLLQRMEEPSYSSQVLDEVYWECRRLQMLFELIRMIVMRQKLPKHMYYNIVETLFKEAVELKHVLRHSKLTPEVMLPYERTWECLMLTIRCDKPLVTYPLLTDPNCWYECNQGHIFYEERSPICCRKCDEWYSRNSTGYL